MYSSLVFLVTESPALFSTSTLNSDSITIFQLTVIKSGPDKHGNHWHTVISSASDCDNFIIFLFAVN